MESTGKSEKVYSPSQTERWDTCPVLWKTEYKDGWKPRVITKREVAGIQGTAFSEAMATYNIERMAGMTPVVDHAVGRAEATVDAMLTVLTGQGFDVSILAQYGDLSATLATAITRTIEEDATPSEWKIVAVEETRPNYGYARCDVVYERPDGGRTVRDYKYTQAIEKRYVPDRLRDYGEAAQRHHYQWMEGADCFLVTLVTANPFHVYEQPFMVDPVRLNNWVQSQRVKWQLMERMEKGELSLYEADSHITKFGRGDSARCPLYEWCLEYHRDPSVLETIGFIKVERSRG